MDFLLKILETPEATGNLLALLALCFLPPLFVVIGMVQLINESPAQKEKRDRDERLGAIRFRWELRQFVGKFFKRRQ